MVLSKWTMTQKEYGLESNYNNYVIHQKLCKMFDQTSIIFHVNINNVGQVDILIQSINTLKYPPLYGAIKSSNVLDLVNVLSDDNYKISVKLNAVKQLSIKGKKNHKKIPIVGKFDITNWLKSKSNDWGIDIGDVLVSNTNDFKILDYYSEIIDNTIHYYGCIVEDIYYLHNKPAIRIRFATYKGIMFGGKIIGSHSSLYIDNLVVVIK